MDDENVWNSIKGDTTMIFQWESPMATQYIRRLFSDETVKKIKEVNDNFSYMDLFSIGNGALRPAGESYRDKLAKGIFQDNGHEALNNFLAHTLGFLIYQEEIIEFLHSFCGFTMGEADIVRRGFAKKTGTEKFIPKIKSGFIETMKNKYNLPKEESETLIINFIKVIEDASSYLFSENHAVAYSWIGYICGYLRYYYPIEFITSALNIFEDKEIKSATIINYAKCHGITILPIKFGYSKADYNFNKDSGAIFKGISSIKFMNKTVANEIYDLRNNNYGTFIDLLYDLKNKTSLNSRQLSILIKLDFFEMFGDSNYLLYLSDKFDKIGSIAQLSKSKIDSIGIDVDLIRANSEKETEKTFLKINPRNILNEICKKPVDIKKSNLQQKLESQLRYLGYIDTFDEAYKNWLVVRSVDIKYAPRLQVYSLRNGTIFECKIQNSIFNKNKLRVNDVIKVAKTTKKPKSKRMEDGSFKTIPNTTEYWLDKYKIMFKIKSDDE